MSRAGALIDYLLGKVSDVVAGVNTTDVEQALDDLKDSELPFCLAWDWAKEQSLGDYKQRDETTTISLAYVQKASATKTSFRDVLDVAEDIEESIWDGNVLDTDGAGFFAYVSASATGKSEQFPDRYILLMEVTIESTDMADSAFALTEDNL